MNLVWVHLFTKVDSLRWGNWNCWNRWGTRAPVRCLDGGFFWGRFGTTLVSCYLTSTVASCISAQDFVLDALKGKKMVMLDVFFHLKSLGFHLKSLGWKLR